VFIQGVLNEFLEHQRGKKRLKDYLIYEYVLYWKKEIRSDVQTNYLSKEIGY
jgi:hypothetical protein